MAEFSQRLIIITIGTFIRWYNHQKDLLSILYSQLPSYCTLKNREKKDSFSYILHAVLGYFFNTDCVTAITTTPNIHHACARKKKREEEENMHTMMTNDKPETLCHYSSRNKE